MKLLETLLHEKRKRVGRSNHYLGIDFATPFLEIDFNGETLLKMMSGEGEIVGDNFLDIGLSGDDQ